MSIKIDKENKKIIIPIPLTTTSGKIRIKERDNIYGYGLPFASKTNKFNQKNYVEWQIGYDVEINTDKVGLTSLEKKNFIAYNRKHKALYELSEYLYYFVDFGIFSKEELKKLKNEIEQLCDDNLISKHSHCAIKRTHPIEEEINKLNFEILKIEYPQLIYKFKNYEIIAEITIREKQRAIGVQPMLYFCFPITELKSVETLIGRCAVTKEKAFFEINEKNSFIILKIFKIFGMLSPSHRYDILKILDLIIEEN